MADFLLSVGVDVGLSYDQMQKDISALVTQLNQNPQRVQVGLEIDQSAIERFRTEVANIHNSMGGVGRVTVNPVDTGGLNNTIDGITHLAQSTQGAISTVQTMRAELNSVNAERIQQAIGSVNGISAEGAAALARNLSEANVHVREVEAVLSEATNAEQQLVSLVVRGADAYRNTVNYLMTYNTETGEIDRRMTRIRAQVEGAADTESRRATTVREITDLYRQIHALMRTNANAANTASYAELANQSQLLQNALDLIQTESISVDEAFTRLGITGTTAINGAKDAMSAFRLEMEQTGSSGTVSLTTMHNTVAQMQNLLNNNAGHANLGAYQNLQTQVNLLAQAIELASNDGITLEAALNAVGLNGSTAIQNAREAMSAFKMEMSGATAEEKTLVAGTQAYNTALNKVNNLLIQVRHNTDIWSKAKNGRSAASYKIYSKQAVELEKLSQKLKTGEITAQKFDKEYSKIRSTVVSAGAKIKAAGEATQSWSKRIGGLSAKFSTWFSITRVIMSAYRAVREMISVSIELENAFTQLKIVTGATDSEMERFMATSVNLAKSLGKSVTEVTNSIEVFSRLGYSLEEAAKLAEYATILSNVASVDTNDATTGLTSIVKGYDLDVSEASHIADVLVSVGQEYAVSASELMEAYARCGAALNATNTSFEKSAGLIAAANASVQDASTVGTALKTVSARIRGSKTDLEELGETTEDLAGGFSKYAKEIKSLTGFDIMVEGTTNQFKDIYDIFKGISQVWDKLSDTQQARVSEILGGTRQLQVISSIIGNWEDAAGAYARAMDSAGVATNANNIYMETAAAHIQQLKATFEDLGSSLIKSGFITTIVDIGTGILSFLNTLQKLHMLLPMLIASIVTIKGISMSRQISATTQALIGNKVATEELILSVSKMTVAQKKRLVADIQAAVVAGRLTNEEAAQILTTLGLATAEGTLTITNKGLAASFKSLMASIPVLGWIALGISVVIEAITLLSSSIESSEDKLDRLSQEYSDITSKISSLNSELETTRDRIQELEEKGSLTIVEQNELEKLKETNAELSRQAILYERQQKLKATDVSNAFVDSVDGWKKGIVVNQARRISRGSISDGREEDPRYSFYLDREKAFAYYLELYKNSKEYDKHQEYPSTYSSLKKDFETADEQLSSFMDTIDEYQEKVKDVGYKYLSDDAKEAYDYITDLQNRYLLTTAETSEDVQVVFDSIYNSERFSDAKNELEAFGKKGKLTAEKIRELYENNDSVKQMVDNMAEIGLIDLSKPYAAFKGLAEQLNVVKPEVEETAETITKSIDEITEKIDSIQEKYKTVLSVFNDYQENGFLSLDNIQSLLALDTKYLQLLTDEGGQLKLNTDAFWKLIDAELTELELKKARELLPNIKTMSLEEAQAYATARAIDAQTESTNSLIEAMIREEMLQAVTKDQQNNTNAFTNAVKASLSPMTTVVSLIEQARENYKQYGSAMLDSSGATNKQTDALEKQKEALEDNKKSLEKEKELLEDRTDSISDLVDLVTDMITKTKELEKEAFEEEKERIDELIEKQKELLESKKDNADFDRELADKQRSVATNAIAAAVASLDTSSAGKKAFKEASDNLEESKNDLSEYLADHEYEVRVDALDKLKDESDKYYDDRIDAIDKYLDDERKLYEDACKAIENDNGTLYNKLLTYVRTYTTKSDAEFNRLWTKAQEGIQAYSDKNLALIDLIGYLKDGIYQTEDAIDGLSKSIDTISDSIDNMSNKVGSNLSDGINNATVSLEKFKELYDQFNKVQKEAEDKYKSTPLWIFEENGKRYYSSMSDRGAAANQIAGQIEKETGYYRTDIIAGLTKINPNEIKWFFADGNNVYYSTLSDRNKAAVEIGSQIQRETGYYRPDIISGIKAYASGTKSAQGGLSLVGENGAEFRVLNQGDGIINAKLTERLIQLGTNPVDYLKQAYSKVFEQLSSQRMMSDTIENMFGNIRNIPINTRAVMQNGTVAPSIQINIQGDATQSTVNALKAQANKIIDMAVNKTMNTALKYSNKPRIN